MTHIDSLIEQHIREYESRLKHIDELLERAAQAGGDEAQQSGELSAFKRDRDQLTTQIDELKRKPAEAWQRAAFEKAGPMGVWDTVADRLERLVERFEKS